jgi:hypothetical protein
MAPIDDRPFGPSVWEDPLTYPGTWPPASCRLLGDRLVELPSVDAALDEGRHAVLAVGSNGSAAQLHRKLVAAGLPVDVPLLRVSVGGLVPAFAAWPAPYGSLPTSACAAPGASSDLVLNLVTDEQAAALDHSEGGYGRPTLDPATHPVAEVASRRVVAGVSCYVTGGDLLADPATGEPVVLRPQRELWAWLLETVPGAVELCGPTPEDAVAALATDRQRRSAFAVLLIRSGATTPVRPVAAT